MERIGRMCDEFMMNHDTHQKARHSSEFTLRGRTNRENREKSQRIVAQGYSHAYNPRIHLNRL